MAIWVLKMFINVFAGLKKYCQFVIKMDGFDFDILDQDLVLGLPEGQKKCSSRILKSHFFEETWHNYLCIISAKF
jgi:hypothetical protein